jgi:actin-related protein
LVIVCFRDIRISSLSFLHRCLGLTLLVFLLGLTKSFAAYSLFELGKDIKEAVCKISDTNLVDNELRFSSLPTSSYELPDGTIIDLGIERFSVTELFFDSSPLQQLLTGPSTGNSTGENVAASSSAAAAVSSYFDLQDELNHLNAYSSSSSSSSILPPFSYDTIPKMICDSVLRSEQDIQSTLLANIILTGGNSCYDGLLERIKYEVERRIYQQVPGMKVKMFSNNTTEKPLTAWLGGSIVGSLGSFHEVWINKAEYEEYGSHIVDRKCP